MEQPACRLSEVAVAGHDPARWVAALALLRPGTACLDLDCENRPLPLGMVAALPDLTERLRRVGTRLRLSNLSRPARQALHLIGQSHVVPDHLPEDRDLIAGTWPISLRSAEPGRLVITVRRDAGQSSVLSSPTIHDWFDGLVLDEVAVDLGRLDQINSVLVAWLLQLGQHIKPLVLEAFAIAPTVMIQLTQLRIGQLMTLRPA